MNPKLRQRVLSEWTGGLVPLEFPSPANLAAVLQKAFTRLGIAERLRETTLMESWHEVVGPTLSPHCRPGAIRRGVLTVRVDHPAWLHQITLAHKKDILLAAQARFPHLKIKELLLRIG